MNSWHTSIWRSVIFIILFVDCSRPHIAKTNCGKGAPCTAGWYCVHDACRKLCHSNDECSNSGETCVDEVCLPATGIGDLPAGSVCDDDKNCESGICVLDWAGVASYCALLDHCVLKEGNSVLQIANGIPDCFGSFGYRTCDGANSRWSDFIPCDRVLCGAACSTGEQKEDRKMCQGNKSCVNMLGCSELCVLLDEEVEDVCPIDDCPLGCEPTTGVCIADCLTNNECEPNVCRGGTCQTQGTLGQACDAVDGNTDCLQTPIALNCLRGQCVAGECAINNDCTLLEVCRSTICQPVGLLDESCDIEDVDADCSQTPIPMICASNGICKIKIGSTCTLTNGTQCVDGFCTCQNADCTGNRICSHDVCAPCKFSSTGESCDGNLVEGTFCPTAGECAEGICKIPDGQECTSSPSNCRHFCRCSNAFCTVLTCTAADCGPCEYDTGDFNNLTCDGGELSDGSIYNGGSQGLCASGDLCYPVPGLNNDECRPAGNGNCKAECPTAVCELPDIPHDGFGDFCSCTVQGSCGEANVQPLTCSSDGNCANACVCVL